MTSMYMDDPIWDSYAPLIRNWDELTKIPPDVLPGSQLYEDREAGTPELAWTALVAAADSLSVLLKLYEHESEEFHEIATFSVARAPFIAASTAYWLLAPPKHQRRIARGLSLLEANLAHIESFSSPLLEEGDEDTVDLNKHIEQERVRIASQWSKIGVPAKEKPTDTWIIDFTARELEKTDRCNHVQVLGLWRLCSGHAHAMRWAAKMPKPDDPYSAMNDLMGVGVALTHAGFELWNERTTVHP